MKLTTFQLVVLGFFGLCLLAGVGIFATVNNAGNSSVGHVVIWGTAESDTMENLLTTLRKSDQKTFDQVVSVLGM